MTETLQTLGKSRKRRFINETITCDVCNYYRLDSSDVFEYIFTCDCCGKAEINICNNCIVTKHVTELREIYSKITHKSIDLV